ncbi:MAG: metal-dependent hydrolase [Nitrospirota bacterium]
MDPVTHSLIGTTIYNLGFKRRLAFWVLLLASIAPDFDYVTRIWGLDVFLRYHRGITHGIAALFAMPVAIGLIFGLKKGFIYYTSISFLAYGVHLFADLTNQYGIRILSPLDWEQYSLDLIFILDPYITLGLLLSVALCKINKKKAASIAIITSALLVFYMGGRYYLQGKTGDFVKERIDASIYRIYPLPNDFLRWWFIAKSGSEIKAGFADLFTQRICVQETYSIKENDPFIKRSKETRVVRNFLYFSRFPHAEIKREGDKPVVTWRELSYSFLAGDHFVAKVIFDDEGRVINSYFKF